MAIACDFSIKKRSNKIYCLRKISGVPQTTQERKQAQKFIKTTPDALLNLSLKNLIDIELKDIKRKKSDTFSRANEELFLQSCSKNMSVHQISRFDEMNMYYARFLQTFKSSDKHS